MKHCHDCDQDKPHSEFYEYDGEPYTPCKACRIAKARERVLAKDRELQSLRTIVAAIGAQVTYAGSELA